MRLELGAVESASSEHFALLQRRRQPAVGLAIAPPFVAVAWQPPAAVAELPAVEPTQPLAERLELVAVVAPPAVEAAPPAVGVGVVAAAVVVGAVPPEPALAVREVAVTNRTRKTSEPTIKLEKRGMNKTEILRNRRY